MDVQRWIQKIQEHFAKFAGDPSLQSFLTAATTALQLRLKKNLENKYTRILQFLHPQTENRKLAEKDLALLTSVATRVAGSFIFRPNSTFFAQCSRSGRLTLLPWSEKWAFGS